ncbi:protein GRAVITROPIC IN THE LIGHT 1-like [Nymphaea colorata]|uniref:Uncharacterized protein n=1 Tax=Nymphaea colorata TaxID=210225 RepID=A0A5K0YNJ6_9MAGN|nr:protein GRAVITROPIC IN THE LIGHT 1-like [Nymphaea colorata]VVV79135.1 unnamed protein product [Nymphaea colorata]
MTEMEREEGAVKAPQISQLFQRFASVCKSKTMEFFAEEEDYEQIPTMGNDDFESKEEIITDQKVVVIKPDHLRNCPSEAPKIISSPPLDSLVSCILASVSAFESAYVQLQTAHAPFDVENVKTADRAAIAQLRKLSEIKHLGRNCGELPSSEWILEAQVQERQSMLRTYEMTVNRLQAEIDRMDAEASTLKEQIKKLGRTNSRWMKRLDELNSRQVAPSLSIFDSALQKATKLSHSFAKTLIEHMKQAKWNLDYATDSLYPGTCYAKKGHNKYALLSYVCLEMFSEFDSETFSEINVSILGKKDCLQRFVQCRSLNAVEVLRRNSECGFSKFCRKKYLQLLHPKMEASFFENLEQRDMVVNHDCTKWPLDNPLFESFVKMAYSIWLLHVLAFAFDPVIEIFQVKSGDEFCMVFMEDVVQGSVLSGSGADGSRARVGFTVVPGFRVGKTIIQCQVYLNGMIYIE